MDEAVRSRDSVGGGHADRREHHQCDCVQGGGQGPRGGARTRKAERPLSEGGPGAEPRPAGDPTSGLTRPSAPLPRRCLVPARDQRLAEDPSTVQLLVPLSDPLFLWFRHILPRPLIPGSPAAVALPNPASIVCMGGNWKGRSALFTLPQIRFF